MKLFPQELRAVRESRSVQCSTENRDKSNQGSVDQVHDCRRGTEIPISRRTALSLIGVGLVGSVVGASGAAARFAGGNGTEASPYQIETWAQLHEIRFAMDDEFELIADLDADSEGYDDYAAESTNDGEGWDPIGFSGGGFSGVLNGNGHTISGAYINRTGTGDDHIGLFGVLDPNAVIENLGVKNGSITGRNEVGGLVGHARGKITRCFAVGPVTGEYQYGSTMIGGLVGNNYANITECYASAHATGNSNVGGFVGLNNGAIVESYYDSNLASTGIGDEDGDENDVTGVSTDDMYGITPAPWGENTMPAFDFDADWTVEPDAFPRPRPPDPETVLDPIGPFEEPPRDLDGDGLYEDINGDGDATVADVQALHQHLDDDVVTNNSQKFDFSGKNADEVTQDDVTALYDIVTGDDDA